MGDDRVDTPRLRELLAGLTEGLLNSSEERELSDLLHASDAARDFYREYMAMDALLWWEYTLPAEPPTPPASKAAFPVLSVLDNAVHGTAGYLAQGWPLSYLVALLIVGVGLTIGSLVHVSLPDAIANRSFSGVHSSSPSVNAEALARTKAVGWITGMVDCVLEKSCPLTVINGQKDLKSEVRKLKSPVSLGDCFAVRSGLLEITYETGARVILQGPATYDVESVAGGYLAVGKLTARLEKKEELGTKNEEYSVPHSSLVPISSFAVRTPTAVVTDLGTEFGVNVDESGNTLCEVFRGEVQVVRAGGDRNAKPMRLIRGEAARVDASDVKTIQANTDSVPFVRDLSASREQMLKRPRVLISTVDKGQSWWRYSVDSPKGDWTKAGFDDSYWLVGKSSFGYWGGLFKDRSPRPLLTTAWPQPDLWLRQEVVVREPLAFSTAVLTIFHDSEAEVFVNGRNIFRDSKSAGEYECVDVTEVLRAALKEGTNLIAAHAKGVANQHQMFDMGLTLDPKDNSLPALTVSEYRLQGKAMTLIPTTDESPAAWRWTTKRPAGAWLILDFDHAGWKEGYAGFGVSSEAIIPETARIGTLWDDSDIWLRKIVDVPEVPVDYLGVIKVFHDEDIEVFVNGQLVFAEPNATLVMKNVDVTELLKKALRRGENVVAVHVHQTWGGQYVDVGLKLYRKDHDKQ